MSFNDFLKSYFCKLIFHVNFSSMVDQIQIIEKTVHNLLKVRQLLIAPLTEIDISTASSDEN